MNRPVHDPGDRDPGDDPAAREVAAVIAAVVLPSIESFGPDSVVLAGLPAYVPYPAPVPEPASRVSVARAVQDAAVAALAAVRVLEARTAALKAALITRHLGAARVEAAALALDPWQAGMAQSCATAEIATTLQIPEGTAKALAHHAGELLTGHPDTLAALAGGTLSWRHACTIIDETATLADTPGLSASHVQDFEARLLATAPGTTGGGFASRARRMREGTHPESLTTRMREAIAKRSLSVEPGKDGMAWLTLHLPAPAAMGAFVQCTRLARTQQGPGEHRTLDQLRADTATTLLLGTPPPTNTNHETTNHETGNHTLPTRPPAAGTPAAGTPAEAGTGVLGDGAREGSGPVGELVAGPLGAVAEGVMAEGVMAGGVVAGGVVEGIMEDPLRNYLHQLEATGNAAAITDPPLPRAQVIVTVPALGLLGVTNEPALLAGHGPIPQDIARKLLGQAGSFLRVLTDPLSNAPLPGVSPERYRLREAEKTLLRALNETCSFPNCTNPALDTETDHLTPWAQGGATTRTNLHPNCRRHHGYRHFRDDKDRHGRYRQDQDTTRAAIKLRGWKPTATADGRVGWTSPTGTYHPPQPATTQAPAYPKWVKKHLTKKLATHTTPTTTTPTTTPAPAPRFDTHPSPFEQLLEYQHNSHFKNE